MFGQTKRNVNKLKRFSHEIADLARVMVYVCHSHLVETPANQNCTEVLEISHSFSRKLPWKLSYNHFRKTA